MMISNDEAKALDHARILEFHKFYSEFQFWLEADASRFRVTIRIYQTSDGRFFFVQSHFMKTPAQADLPAATNFTHPAPHQALSSAVESIVSYYEDAIKLGHAPSSDWFVANDLF